MMCFIFKPSPNPDKIIGVLPECKKIELEKDGCVHMDRWSMNDDIIPDGSIKALKGTLIARIGWRI